MTTPSTALIIGASRGLGLALAREWLSRGWNVLATVRSAAHTALHETAATSGGRLTIEQLDTADPAGVDALRQRLSGRELDLLFVAGDSRPVAHVYHSAIYRLPVPANR